MTGAVAAAPGPKAKDEQTMNNHAHCSIEREEKK